MDRLLQSSALIIGRTVLVPAIRDRSRCTAWFTEARKLVAEIARDMTEARIDPDEADEQFDNIEHDTGYFLRGLGRVDVGPPGRRLIRHAFKHSRLPDEPIYVRCNWRIEPESPVDANMKAIASIRIHGTGVITTSCHIRVLAEQGLRLEDHVSLLRAIMGDSKALNIVWRARAGPRSFTGSMKSVLEAVHLTCLQNLVRPVELEKAVSESVHLEPLHMFQDLGRAQPPWTLPVDSEPLSQLLVLSTDPNRQVTHANEAQVALFKSDWIGATRKQMLFCDTGKPWPNRRTERWGDIERIRGARRQLRRRAAVDWHLFEVAEVARMARITEDWLADSFQHANLEMLRAQNESWRFIKTMLTPTFYDDKLFTLAMDLQELDRNMVGRRRKLYEYMSKVVGEQESRERMTREMESFREAVSHWKPGVKSLVGLLKAAH